jgi:hypothetical protein
MRAIGVCEGKADFRLLRFNVAYWPNARFAVLHHNVGFQGISRSHADDA